MMLYGTKSRCVLWSTGGFHTTAAIVFIFGSSCAYLYCMGSSSSCLPIHHFIIAVPVEFVLLTFLPSWILLPPLPCFHSCSNFPFFCLFLIPLSNCFCFVSLELEAILVLHCLPPHHIVQVFPGFKNLMLLRCMSASGGIYLY